MDPLAEALRDMLYLRMGFVLAEIGGTDRFVQFANSRGRIVLDIPRVALSEEEQHRAAALFTRLGGGLAYWNEHRDAQAASYQLECGVDCTRAAMAARDVIAEVFKADPDAELVITLG